VPFSDLSGNAARVSPAGALQAEERLDLIPDRKAEDDGEEEQREQEHLEAAPGPFLLPLVLDAGASFGALAE
jgi:hypothetical protein